MEETHQATKKISITGTISESFNSLKGIKGYLWLLIILMIAITALLNFISHDVLKIDVKEPPFYFAYIILPIITNIIIAPFYAGAIMICVSHLRQETIKIKTGFSYFNLYFQLGLAMAIIGFLGSLFIIILNIPALANILGQHKIWLDFVGGIYSLFIYTFFILTIPLIADKKYRPLHAMKESCKRISSHWIKILIIIVLTYLIMLLCTIPLLVGVLLGHFYIVILGGVLLAILLIWVLPFLFMIQGMIYYKLDENQQVRS